MKRENVKKQIVANLRTDAQRKVWTSKDARPRTVVLLGA